MISNKIRVNMGKVAVGSLGDIFVTGGVGSCLVICLYDKKNRTGCMAHAMYPKKSDHLQAADNYDSRYVDVAIRLMLDKLLSLGSNKLDIAVKIVGGANIFTNINLSGKKSIGELNIDSAREECARHGLAIIKQIVGGSRGRQVEFDLGKGLLKVNLTN